MSTAMTVHCSALCGNNAVGNLAVTEKISLPLCTICRELIDEKQVRICEIRQGGLK
jgi:hypothetical protein